MCPDQIFAVVAVLLAGEDNPRFDQLRSGDHDERYPMTVKACDHAAGVLDVEGVTYACGTVMVPEDFAAPE